jgi:hypothetical protein
VRKAFISIRRIFKRYDQDGSDSIDPEELQTALKELGADLTAEDVRGMFKVRLGRCACARPVRGGADGRPCVPFPLGPVPRRRPT